MPTGYTADVIDGKVTDFKDFATQCMRAFGACIHMRDEPFDKKYEPRVPSEYYYKRYEEIKVKIEDLKNMSDDDILKEKTNKLQDDLTRNKEYLEKKRAHRKLLEDMLDKVNAWNPPTNDHISFKKFMVDQLKQTIDFDCKEDWTRDSIKEIEAELLVVADPKKIREDE